MPYLVCVRPFVLSLLNLKNPAINTLYERILYSKKALNSLKDHNVDGSASQPLSGTTATRFFYGDAPVLTRLDRQKDRQKDKQTDTHTDRQAGVKQKRILAHASCVLMSCE